MNNQRKHNGGYSLIEMLVVIAIMSVLMSLIFPVVTATQQNARRGACISNLNEIGAALKVYRLDEGGYPIVLYGFVNEADLPNRSAAVYGLYPLWVRRQEAFVCPNNPALGKLSERAAITLLKQNGSEWEPSNALTWDTMPVPEVGDAPWTLSDGTGDLKYPNGVRYAVGDSYDLSFLPTRPFGPGSGMWERHYSRQWLPLSDLSDPDQDPADRNHWVSGMTPKQRREVYARQLIFRQPDDETVVTICTYHRKYPRGWKPGTPYPSSSRDPVLFVDGHVENRESNITGRYDAAGWAGWQTWSQ